MQLLIPPPQKKSGARALMKVCVFQIYGRVVKNPRRKLRIRSVTLTLASTKQGPLKKVEWEKGGS